MRNREVTESSAQTITPDRKKEIVRIRGEFFTNGRLRLEFLADLSRLLRVHNVPIADDILRDIVIALIDEAPFLAQGPTDPPSPPSTPSQPQPRRTRQRPPRT